MTSVNVLLQRDQVTVITDTAFYDVGGYVQGFAPKALAIPHWPAVVAMRGPIYAHALLVAKMSLRFECLDAFAENAVEFLREFAEEHHEGLSSYGQAAGIQITAAGFSAVQNACRAFTIQVGDIGDRAILDFSDFGGSVLDLSGGELIELPMDDMCLNPLPPPEALKATSLDKISSFARLDLPAVRRLATEMLQAQRQVSDILAPGEEPTYAAGGRPVFLTVHRDGTISTSAGEPWPDVIGERVDPSRDPKPKTALANEPADMSREQRRRFERMHRQRGRMRV